MHAHRGENAVFHHSLVREQIELLENHTDFLPYRVHCRLTVGQAMAVNDDFSALDGFEMVDAADQC